MSDTDVIELRRALQENALRKLVKKEKATMQSLTGSWMTEISAGHAPLTTEVASIRYPCTPRFS